MGTMIRANRKGGAVAHIMRDASVSVCGRIMAFVPGGEGLRLCKTCARITGVQAEIDTRAFPEIPELSELPALEANWAAIEREWLRDANSFVMGNARDVLTQYMSNPSEYDLTNAHTVRLLAKYRAYLKLHTGADFCDPVDSVAPSMQRQNNGGGMIDPKNARPARKTGGMTDAQFNALAKMARWIEDMHREIAELKGIENADHGGRVEFLESMRDEITRKDIDNSFKNYSRQIDELKAELAELKRNARKTATVKTPAADEGYFMYGDTFLCVKSNRAGTGQYATVWSHDTESWEFDRAQSYSLMQRARKGEFPRVTPEAAASFGELYGRCMRCSRKLTDANSIAEAMGKVCAGKMGF